MDLVSQKCFGSSLVLHTRFPHNLGFLLGGLCKAELVIPVFNKKGESTL